MPSPPGQDRSATVWDIRSWGGRARARRTAGEIAKCRPVGQNGAMRMITADRLGGILAGITGPGDGHGPRAVAPGSFATPVSLLNLMAEHLAAWRLFIVNALDGIPERGVTHETIFVGPGMRRSADLRYYPCRLSLAPRLFTDTLPPDVVVLHTSTPRDGRVSMGIEVQVMTGALEAARARNALVIAQVNPKMPFVHGDGVVDLAEIDFGVEIDQDLPVAPRASIDPVSRRIGQSIAALVPDGATVQAGIGALPDAVLNELSVRRGLRVWTELVSDGYLRLERAGALDPEVPITGTFMLGTPEFYAWVDDNPRVRLLRCEITNDPGRIAEQPAMVSVNTALQVDLFAQNNASRIRHRPYSGTGGAADFVVGAMRSAGGRSIIALPSWHAKSDSSTIVPQLDQPVTTLQPSTVVTEQGVAEIFGRCQRQQAGNLIDRAAHPAARGELRSAARRLGLL